MLFVLCPDCDVDVHCRYVGSPYQTTLSEAGQDKFFYRVSNQPFAAAPNTTDTASVNGSGSSNSSNQIQWKRAATAEDGAEVASNSTTAWRELERWVVSIGSKIIRVRLRLCLCCLFDCLFFV
jgi:hypothetical protein